MSLLRPYRLYTERRLNRRFTVDMGARIEMPEVTMVARVLDVSREGLKLVVPDYIKPETPFTLHLDLPGQEDVLNLNAKVVACRLIPRERQFVAGIRLIGPSAHRIPELQALLTKLAAENN